MSRSDDIIVNNLPILVDRLNDLKRQNETLIRQNSELLDIIRNYILDNKGGRFLWNLKIVSMN